MFANFMCCMLQRFRLHAASASASVLTQTCKQQKKRDSGPLIFEDPGTHFAGTVPRAAVLRAAFASASASASAASSASASASASPSASASASAPAPAPASAAYVLCMLFFLQVSLPLLRPLLLHFLLLSWLPAMIIAVNSTCLCFCFCASASAPQVEFTAESIAVLFYHNAHTGPAGC